MLNASQRVSINDPTLAEVAPNLLAMAWWRTIAALPAVNVDEVENDTPPAVDADDVASSMHSSDEAAPLRYLAALMIAVVLLLAWAGIRSL